MTQFSHALPRSASCSLMHDCGHTKERITIKKVLLRPWNNSVRWSPSWLVLPEGLYDIGGGCGSSIKIGFPREGDGGAGNVGDLRFGWGTGDQVWVGRSVWLDWDSKLWRQSSQTERKGRNGVYCYFQAMDIQHNLWHLPFSFTEKEND